MSADEILTFGRELDRALPGQLGLDPGEIDGTLFEPASGEPTPPAASRDFERDATTRSTERSRPAGSGR